LFSGSITAAVTLRLVSVTCMAGETAFILTGRLAKSSWILASGLGRHLLFPGQPSFLP
jgi:hypothetical protein